MPTLRPACQLTDAELIAEARALDAQDDQDSLQDLVSMLSRTIPGYVVRSHLRVISRAFQRVAAGDIDRLLINTPPQVGKTVTAVVGGAFWWLARRPRDRIIIASYGDKLAVDRGRDVRKLVTTSGHRFGLELEPGSKSVSDWRLQTGGGVRSVGVGGGIAGTPAHLAIIDDPHKNREEADSKPFRDRVYKWLSGDIVSRLAPGAPIIMVMTLWDPDDLAGRVTRDEGTTTTGGRWHVIRMPAICTNPANDPLHRNAGDPLPHPAIPEHDRDAALEYWNLKRHSTTVRDWFALYGCDPRPVEGALLDRDLLRERRCYQTESGCATAHRRTAVAVDPSGGGRDTAGIIGGYLATDGRVYLSHDRTGVMPSHDWSRAVCQLAWDIDADLIVVERNFGGDMANRMIRSAWWHLSGELHQQRLAQILADNPDLTPAEAESRADMQARVCPRVQDVSARKSKRLRAEPIAQAFIEDRVRFSAYLPDVEEEWATWQVGSSASPGRIDASVYLAYALLPKTTGGSGGAAPSGSMPTTSSSPLAGGNSGSGFGPLG